MAESGVSAAELGDAKTYLTGSYPLRFSASGRIAAILVGIQLDGLGIDYIEKRNSLIEAVTLDDVNRVASELLAPGRLTTVIVGEPEELSEDG
jgi:zinc protease